MREGQIRLQDQEVMEGRAVFYIPRSNSGKVEG